MSSARINPAVAVSVLLQLISTFTVSVLGQQSFRESPEDLSIIQGQTAVLKCGINNKAGQVQWTKAGFSLGFDRSIPGYSRYTMYGSDALGEYNLMITEVNLNDDAEYQCQVGPAANNPPLVGKAYLTVLVPPSQPEIAGFTNGTVDKVSHKTKEKEFTCSSDGGKPAATIKWYKSGTEITEGITSTSSAVGNKLENTKSVLKLPITSEDDAKYISCQATNPAQSKPLETMIMLTVLHPPGPPEIEGYSTGQVVKTGETVRLLCTSRGGNPLAQVYWYKNDKELDFSYTSGSTKSQNELIFTVDPTDNNARYRCEVSNIETPEPLTAEMKLIVQFAPDKVTITGHQNAKAGETITLSCVSGISNPPAIITWFTRGRQLVGAVTETKASPRGGFVTSSNISVTLTEQEDKVVYQCHGTNDALGRTRVDTVTLSVMYPPEKPTISGYVQGKEVMASKIQSLTCTAVGGNPPAVLTWWKGDEQLEAANRVAGSYVSSDVSFILKPDDNGAEYRCNATNPATPEPLLSVVTLKVNFPPDSITITTEPAVARAGQRLMVTCRSASSNPPSQMSWWKDGEEISGIDGGMEDASHGGKSSISRLELMPTEADDQQVYGCRASNVLLDTTVNDAVTLNILHAPLFVDSTPTKFDVIEYTPATLNLTCKANPGGVTYKWFKNTDALVLGAARKKRDVKIDYFVATDGVLDLKNVTRADAGNYTVEAMNAEGATNFTFLINVQYPAGVASISEKVLFDISTTATLECVADANPHIDKMITWKREGYDLAARGKQVYDSGKSVLTIEKLTKEDAGKFICAINNGIGEEATKEAELVVKFKPEIDKSERFSKAAADKGATATVICLAQAAPSVTFKWFKGETEIDMTSSRFSMETKQVDTTHYENNFVIVNTTEADYVEYNCKASNPLGEDEHKIVLGWTRIPDPPSDVKFVNHTHDSLTISWTPGFDGGLAQTFQVRYNEYGVKGYKYADVVHTFPYVYTISGLELGTDYEISVAGVNKLGRGGFAPQIKEKTSTILPPEMLEQPEADDVPLIIILTVSIVGLVLLGLNVLLILFFIRRRKRRGLSEKESSETFSQGNTVELFGNGSAKLTAEEKSYTTYDRSTEDFSDEMSRTYEEDEELRKAFLPPRYMADPTADTRYPSHSPVEMSGMYPHPLPPRDTGHYSSLPRVNPGVVNPGMRQNYLPRSSNTLPLPMSSGKRASSSSQPSLPPIPDERVASLDLQHGFPVSREQVYYHDNGVNGSVQSMSGHYAAGSALRAARQSEDEAYADQLRRTQRQFSQPQGQPAVLGLGRPDSRSSVKSPPPPPPMRVSSRGPMDSIPRVNYNADDINRFTPTQGQENPHHFDQPYGPIPRSQPTANERPGDIMDSHTANQSKDEMQGDLV